MAAISLADCTIRKRSVGEVDTYYIVTDALADSADTIDVTALLEGRKVIRTYGWDVTGGDEATATYTIATDVIIVDAAGGTTNHQYVITVDMLHI